MLTIVIGSTLKGLATGLIDAADTTAARVWLDPQKAQAWVLAQLKVQAITMRAA